MRKALGFALALVMILALLACGTPREESAGSSGADAASNNVSSEVAVMDCPILQDDNFGNVYIDMTIDEFNAKGF